MDKSKTFVLIHCACALAMSETNPPFGRMAAFISVSAITLGIKPYHYGGLLAAAIAGRFIPAIDECVAYCVAGSAFYALSTINTAEK